MWYLCSSVGNRIFSWFYIESEKAIRDSVSRFSSTSDNEVRVEMRDIIEILALRARTPRTHKQTGIVIAPRWK